MNRPPPTGLLRFVYAGLGLLFVGLAGLGVVLPGLPATPFVLLASYFFVRSSPRLHGWLLRSRVFGGLLRDWERHRGVRRSVKVTAFLLIPAAVALSLAVGGLPLWANGVLVALAGVGVYVVYRLPVVPADA
jgi:uncharacterized membrane protein YbaN (DUF454 family)